MENKLNEYNIFALRDLARRTGVKSPTSKKKEVLIQEIMDIRAGKQAPQLEEKRQGRPPKTFGYNLSNVFSFIDEETTFAFNQQETKFEDGNLVTVVGVLELVNNNAGILWVENKFSVDKYFVPAAVMNKYVLRMGDRVVAKTTGDESQKIITDMFNINGIPVAQFKNKRQDHAQIVKVLPNQKLNFKNEEFANLNLMKGENCYVYGSNNNDNTLAVVNLINSVESENKIYVNTTITSKTRLLLKGLCNCERYTCEVTDSVEISRRLILLAVERVKRVLEVKESVVVFVDDMLSISGIDNDSLNLVRTLVSLACETNKHGSITLVSVMPDNSLVQIEKLADKRIEVVGEKIMKK